MSTLQIGARLVRAFGEGTTLRKVISETVNGKTFTKVLDAKGETIANRVKAIAKQEVGNKNVITKTTVTTDKYNSTSKLVTDRVYNQSGELLGSRGTKYSIGYNGINKLKSMKQAHGTFRVGRGFNLQGESVIATNKHLDEWALPGRAYSREYSYGKNICCNNKGLPIPPGLDFDQSMSLKEMRDWHILNNPGQPYAGEMWGLQALDNRTEGLAKLNSLDQYI